ncbi:unnamed protein product, partial [Mesorhabditis belari]|uniref:Uncharacterized protein n=1 Tax=Mesorhabditis belari TaxID=2138241 RepID=A0AAF3JC05_9BILA
MTGLCLCEEQEIAWIVVVIQTIVIVALSLLFFTYVIYNTQPTNSMHVDDYHGTDSHEVNRTSMIMRKHPRLGHSWENSIDGNPNGVEVSIDLINEQKPFGQSSSSSERLPLKTAAVISNDKRCSDIGNAILVRGGNAADASIAALFCLGVTQPQASGLGGGLMGIFCEKGGRCTEVNARETAPQASTKDMFVSNPRDASEGYRAIAVPGELNGLWRMYERFGSHRISWHDLVWPSVELAKKGVRVGADLASIIQLKHRSLFEEETIRSLLINPRTAELYKEGETMQRDRLAETLQQIAEADDPVELFYKDEMGEQVVKEIRKGGGIITKLDFEDYESVLSPALCTSFHSTVSLCGPRPPSSFLITQLIVATMHALYPSNFSDEDLKTVQFHHRFIEASKFAFAQRVTLGDPAFTVNSDYMINLMLNSTYIEWLSRKVPEKTKDFRYYGTPQIQAADHGTSHVSVIDEFGNAIAISSSINTPFGSLRASRFGFVYNSQMDAFSMPNVPSEFGFPPSETNFIQPGKCPMSSLSPIVALNRENGQAILSAGGIGGTRIVPSMASLLTRSLFFERPLAESAQQKLIFSQFIPDNAFFEQGFDRDLLHELSDRGHQVRQMADSRFSVFGLWIQYQLFQYLTLIIHFENPMSFASLSMEDMQSSSDTLPLIASTRQPSNWMEQKLYSPSNISNKQDFEMAKAQLKASSRTSGLLSGFAMIALVELQYQKETPAYLLIILGVVTTLLVSVHLIALMMSTCIRPFIDAYACNDEFPHRKFRFFIDLSWLISTWIGLVLFLIEIGIILLVKFDAVKNYTAGYVTTALLVPVLAVFFWLAWQIHRIKTKHAQERRRKQQTIGFYHKNKALVSIPIRHV